MRSSNLTSLDYRDILQGRDTTKAVFQELIGNIITQSIVIEGNGVPIFKARKHQNYFDTATNKYYRNVDGGTTWVALN